MDIYRVHCRHSRHWCASVAGWFSWRAAGAICRRAPSRAPLRAKLSQDS